LRALSLCTCCRHYPGTATGGTALLIRSVISAFPERVVGSACASSFSRLTQRSLALRPAHSRCHQFVARLPEGFSHFVTSMTAPVASGWSGCRVGLAPTGKAPPFHGAHPLLTVEAASSSRESGRTALSIAPPALTAQAVILRTVSLRSSNPRCSRNSWLRCPQASSILVTVDG